jgi:hypothetical protein
MYIYDKNLIDHLHIPDLILKSYVIIRVISLATSTMVLDLARVMEFEPCKIIKE